MSDTQSQMERLVDALVDTFAFEHFWQGSPIARVCKQLAHERGGRLGEQVRSMEERIASEERAKRDAAELRASQQEAAQKQAIERMARALAAADALGATADGPEIQRKDWRAYVPMAVAAIKEAEGE